MMATPGGGRRPDGQILSEPLPFADVQSRPLSERAGLSDLRKVLPRPDPLLYSRVIPSGLCEEAHRRYGPRTPGRLRGVASRRFLDLGTTSSLPGCDVCLRRPAEARRPMVLPGVCAIVPAQPAARGVPHKSDWRFDQRADSPCRERTRAHLGLRSAEPMSSRDELDRRTFLSRAGWAGWVAATALATGGVSAAIGRLLGPAGRASRAPALGTHGNSASTSTAPSDTLALPSTAAGPAPSVPSTVPAPPTTPASLPAGVVIGPASEVAVGGAASFSAPGSGHAALVLQPNRGRFVAFDATCTHQGCPVAFARSDFRCPCHGAVFNATTGAVIQGPARRRLTEIAIKVGSDGQLYAQ
jgi:Rieske Fe-S protein